MKIRETTAALAASKLMARLLPPALPIALMITLVLGASLVGLEAAGADPKPTAEKGGQHDLAGLSHKLSNPVSDVWALFTEFDFTFSNGNASGGDDKFSFSTLFQPVMPIKLTDSWKVITRPTLPIIWSAPVPAENFDRKTGLGDFVLPLLPSPNNGLQIGPGELVGGVGPTFSFPTATNGNFGSRKYEVGPAAIAVYKTSKVTFGVFPQWFWSVGDKSGHDRPETSHGELLYFFYYNLPNAWQLGFNPVITIDAKASSGNKWNVPLELGFTKMVKIGRVPVKIQVAAQYSVVSQDDYGKRGMLKINLIPVIPDLIKKPLF